MTDHPTTFRAEPADLTDPDWDDRATLYKIDEGQGLLGGFDGLRRGTLAELVHFVQTLPEHERKDYAIQESGDKRYGPHEIAILAQHDNLPPAD
ncbi:MAG: hypothetical protein COW16_03400 [Sphingomonadales bacterium CG12_big_fil_rev_8_21_14_0_65_65_10]|jgi:hypothetical protein|uniref:Uncharacterized protein n=1 Tax=Blastomonas marina TaxID=1867408 RepID=A0ABQ1F8H9_9SPHN|nr:hypothetical protein [Blastomonas marina]PIW55959.1 MAG: hypothetical protein COW16_03400 [Sphingomonadales bacterium CG12_big_fil_rev_8_21_14_0_65_65_10]WPZ04606.1 hypothetical protein T8S45_03435 [Blastomonas marina]GGA03035.1 hypothetical protein GCM10010923_09840 [Blastomonas marina]